jgi:omega-6 fatty acid desaturase (delta-12 desaturase)
MRNTAPVSTPARSGPELIRATKPHSAEDPAQTWRLFALTVVVAAALAALAAWPAAGPGRWVAALLLGLTNVRLFIFYHDTMHGAIFRGSKLGKAIMSFYGLLILTPDRVWKDSHNYHHAHTAKIVGASIGSYPVLTVRMYQRATKLQRALYRFIRSPLNMLLGYFTVFLLGMVIKPLLKNPKRNYAAALSLVVHYGLMAALVYAGGWSLAFFAYWLPLAFSCAAGSYLFYAQHNFPDALIRDRREWEYTDAAIHASSMMTGGPLMRWFTGDIGFHHVHHLNSQIPFYRLEETMAAVPELQAPGETSFAPKDILRCFQLDLWDPDQGAMVSYRQAQASLRAASQAA